MNSTEISNAFKENVHLLGDMLGQTIATAEGSALVDTIETIRRMAKSARSQKAYEHQELADFLDQLTNPEMVLVAKAFSHFLNLANAAGQHNRISRESNDHLSTTQILSRIFADLMKAGHSKADILKCLHELKIEFVLTAHPTEITRRTFIHKYTEIISLLSELELSGHTEAEERIIKNRLSELVTQIWHTENFRAERLTPVDEARWGFAIAESALWDAVPNFIRHLDMACQETLGEALPLDFSPVSFISWMGGDRDGNPNVTARVTREVLLLSRQKSIDLYIKGVGRLFDDLAVSKCDAKLAQKTHGHHEPYRHILRQIMSRLQNTRRQLEAALKYEDWDESFDLESTKQLWQPLVDCYESLCACGMQSIANGRLLSLLHRIKAFDIYLTKLDVRQESSRHTQVLEELTQALGLGSYNDWDESRRQTFLLEGLQNPQPLAPSNWQCSDQASEVLGTFREIARHPPEAFGIYIISMAATASDVLAVQLLMKEAGCKKFLPVAPLFETLDDLNAAADAMRQLSAIEWYRNISGCKQTIMIGYSDSAKDAGILAATWAQYQAQEVLLTVAQETGFELTLFHGRGGSIGRGGAPVQTALLSQPPHSLQRGLRVTEQGEIIRTKFGTTALAVQTLTFYTGAFIQTKLNPPPEPLPEWRKMMDEMADLSCTAYRKLVHGTPDFVAYFQAATPEQELAKLPLGSRPARRRTSGGVEGLRAIPWIFAWNQNRLMLPAWLGAGEALKQVIDKGDLKGLEEMCARWPFFSTRISLLEMVYANADVAISAYYDSVLLSDDAQKAIGSRLRKQLLSDADTVLKMNRQDSLANDLLLARKSLELRNTYLDPLNTLQANLLKRHRAAEEADKDIEQALMMTIAGISAGLGNTG